MDNLQSVQSVQSSSSTEEQPTQQSSAPVGDLSKRQDQNLLMDFSSMFKTTATKRPFKPLADKQQQNKPATANWLLEIPTKITTTLQDLKERKILDLRRWHSISRPQSQKWQGVASVVSVWNYLFSRVGAGTLEPITTEKTLQLLEVAKGQQFDNIEFDELTSNLTLLKWFNKLCQHFSVKSKAQILLKLSGQDHTNITIDDAKKTIKLGLNNDKIAYVYHAYNHFSCPIGYELTPNRPLQAYKKLEQINQEEAQMWLIVAETSRSHPVFNVKRWKDVQQDLETEWPMFFNIREIAKGVQRRPNATEDNEKEPRGTTHCIIQFERLD